MRNKKKKKKGATSAPSLQQLRGDLAVMPKEIFQREHNCSDEEYALYIEQFGSEELASYLYSLTEKIISNEIQVRPEEIRKLVIQQYQYRIINLIVYEYEKSNFVVSHYIGYC